MSIMLYKQTKVEVLSDGKWNFLFGSNLDYLKFGPDNKLRVDSEEANELKEYLGKPVRVVAMAVDTNNDEITGYEAYEFHSWTVSGNWLLALGNRFYHTSLTKDEYKERTN